MGGPLGIKGPLLGLPSSTLGRIQLPTYPILYSGSVVELCLSIPGKVVAVKDNIATIDYGKHGIRTDASTAMISVQAGDYVLVQGGFIIKVLSPHEAAEYLKVWEAVQNELSDAEGGML